MTTLRAATVYEQEIAVICHEANRLYCQAMGDYTQVNWDDAPQWQKDSAIAGVLGIVDGTVTKAEHSHESWLAEKKHTGWVYGIEKNADAKTHPCIVPYADLPKGQQKKDALFFAIVTALK